MDRDAVQALLADAHARLSHKREQVTSELAAAQRREQDLAARADKAAARYRATPVGIAESIRAIEAAMLNGARGAHLRHLQRLHVAAENESHEEYLQRSSRWGHTPGDGPVRGCPVGSGPLVVHILHDKLLGSYRHDPAAEVVAVRLFILGRIRPAVTVDVPAVETLTLSHVLTTAVDTPAMLTRICQRLGLNEDRYRRATTHRTTAAG
ncbi:hypothetical protein [Gordonia alkanivorans]|uniref:hypothetical protein n=1 Tax=Gordonia alkanivorans TaxID=84096 RepID=UPI0004BC8CBF|nr:hypothetical protein [Gordonia alkanivorans]